MKKSEAIKKLSEKLNNIRMSNTLDTLGEEVVARDLLAFIEQRLRMEPEPTDFLPCYDCGNGYTDYEWEAE